MRLRELDGILREAGEVGAVTRIMPEEEDMRAVLVSANENAEELAASIGGKRKLVPQLSQLDAEDIVALMDKLIDPLTEMGLDNDDRGGRGGDRGGRGGFGGRGGDRGPRKDFGGRGRRPRWPRWLWRSRWRPWPAPRFRRPRPSSRFRRS